MACAARASMVGMIPPRPPSTHPHQFNPFGQLEAVYRSRDGAGGLTRYWYRTSNGAAAAEASVIPPPIDTVLLPMKVTELPVVEPPPTDVLPPEGVLPGVRPPPAAFALPDGVDETAAVADAALVGVLAAAVPACDGSQPATTASRVADTALANVKRHRRRGCGAGIAEPSFDRVTRSDDLQWSGSPERLPPASGRVGVAPLRCRRGRKGCRPARTLFDRRNDGQNQSVVVNRAAAR
ncbi:hypothetical protein ABH925_007380 [Streptacidiphilus sp. EB129]